MLETTDGFRIAEEDLRIRGLGEFFGTKQHGLPSLKIGDLLNDRELLIQSRRFAFLTAEEDPSLTRPENSMLRKELLDRFRGRWKLASVG
mgnify:CR=1 FL=1